MNQAQAHDELFCRLAIRQGVMTRDVGIEIIKRFRADPRRSQGIGEFIVREGYLDREVVGTIEGAIAQRAAGHVSEAKRPAARPQLAKGGAGAPPPRRVPHHHATHVPISSTQQILVGSSLVVLVLCVIFIFYFMGSGKKHEDSKTASQSQATTPVLPEVQKFETDQSKAREKRQATYTQEQIDKFMADFNAAMTEAADLARDFECTGLNKLRERRKEMGGDSLPQEIADKFTQAEKQFQSKVDDAYKSLLATAKERKTSGKEEQLAETLEDINRRCGPEYRERAQKELGG